VNRQELSMPPKITLEMAWGLTLYMVKAVMNGRADEMLNLAATNLWCWSKAVRRAAVMPSGAPAIFRDLLASKGRSK
jgi:hypothetical protein